MKPDLYGALLEGIPRGAAVTGAVYGASWAAIAAGGPKAAAAGAGVAMRMGGPGRPATVPENPAGMGLRELAEAVLSWNPRDACLGAAAVNAWYNAPTTVKATYGASVASGGGADPFLHYRDYAAGRRVASVGHFGALDRLIAPVCDLAVLERDPAEGDYPDAAAEYLLPEMELVFITGSAVANRTLPRLLELCRGAAVVLVGPSVPLAPVLFDFGVSALCGSLFPDPAECLAIAEEGAHGRMVKAGIKVHLEACDLRRNA